MEDTASRLDELGPHDGRRPRQIAAQVVSDQRGVGLAEGPYDPGDVEREVGGVVTARGAVAAADPAQVHGHGSEPGVGECHQLVPPRPPELREAVQQQDERPVPISAMWKRAPLAATSRCVQGPSSRTAEVGCAEGVAGSVMRTSVPQP